MRKRCCAGAGSDEATATRAAEVAFADAQARRHNAFKIPLGKRTLVRALLETQAMSVAHEVKGRRPCLSALGVA